MIKNKKAMSSIGMLIIEIVSILLVVILVSYLVENINLTKEKGMSIPGKTIELAKTGFVVKDVVGYSLDKNESNIEGLKISLSTMEGSEDINLETSQIYIMIGNKTARLNIVNGSIIRTKIGGFYTE